MSTLVNRAELETEKYVVGTENKHKKVRKIIAPDEGLGDSERMVRKTKYVIIKRIKKKKQ